MRQDALMFRRRMTALAASSAPAPGGFCFAGVLVLAHGEPHTAHYNHRLQSLERTVTP